ncbi:GNAT family N-acetyltransferase [Sphingorhabdus sp. SMR4y]|uniref:GNAT family N-acetyltransferase n=1 Tax=Sphingorhabdus sp. SMR4y TaxID=2584094 RepID=UPI000B5C3D3B|nr:GNAT family N-acetyltransferase [Sphingorhabdus sp. SMR4y]ASK89592.1 acetyltransferase Pat [Sphingorhabdus sp. SMR4y]
MSAPWSFQNQIQSVDARLDNGTGICLRRVRQSDMEEIEQGIRQMSDQSRYLRFFSGSKSMSPTVVERLANADGINHLAWGVINMDAEGRPAIAAAHVFRDEQSVDTGEFAIAVLDPYHGLGVARILMTALFLDCYCEGLRQLRIDMLRDNKKAYRLIRAVGATPSLMEGSVAQYNLVIEDAITALQKMESPSAIPDIFAAFSAG